MDDVEIIDNGTIKYNYADNDDVQIHFDWFSFTFPLFGSDAIEQRTYLSDIIQSVCTMLGFDYNSEIYYFNYAHNFYKETWQMGVHSCFRAFSQKTKMKINDNYYQSCQFEVSGQGCREIESRMKVDYVKLWKYFTVDLKGKATRVDIAIDDIKGDKIALKDIKFLVENEKFTSKYFRTEQRPPHPEGTLKNGYSITFGARDGNQLCIYDKNSQLASYYGYKVYDDYYVRYEMRFRDKRANDLLTRSDTLSYYLANNDKNAVGEFCKEQLYAMLDLKEKNNYGKSNQYKATTNSKWIEFLNVVKCSKFSLSKRLDSDLVQKGSWFCKQMSGLMLSFGLSNIFNMDDKVIFCNSYIAMFVSFLKKIKEKLKDKRFKKKYLPVVKDYLISNCSYDHTKDIFQQVDEFLKRIDETIEELKEKYSMEMEVF